MNLPLVLDIAIGLFFIYLIFSVLASEIQELITTVFQWRAKHLKEAIESLLLGDNKNEEGEVKRVRDLANKLYSNPLIENINQDATGFFANLCRKITWKSGEIYRLNTNTTRKGTVFGGCKVTGPSYIPSETFATTLLETLKIKKLLQTFTILKLNEFHNIFLKRMKCMLCGLGVSEVDNNTLDNKTNPQHEPGKTIVKAFHNFEKNLEEICKSFKDRTSSLDITIERIKIRLEMFNLELASSPEISEAKKRELKNIMDSLKNDFFEGEERKLLIGGMKLSLVEIANFFDIESMEHKRFVADILKIDKCTHQELKDLIDNLPKSLQESISTLAYRAQSKVETLEKDINQLRQEIELWFERSMERSSGVYKRNAKGIALLIGFLIAIVANTDTFYMLSRLSTDKDLRNAITQNAELANTSCSNTISTSNAAPTQKSTTSTTANTPPNKLDCVRDETKAALAKLSLPIGWNTNNLTDQWSIPSTPSDDKTRTKQWDLFVWNADTIIKRFYPQYTGDLKAPTSIPDWFAWSLIHVLLPVIFLVLFIYGGIKIIWRSQKLTKSTYFWFALLAFLTTCLVIFTGIKVILGVIVGWSLSAIAISMGSAFWFDLLGKVINVRNTGSKPELSTNNQAASSKQATSKHSQSSS